MTSEPVMPDGRRFGGLFNNARGGLWECEARNNPQALYESTKMLKEEIHASDTTYL